MPTTVDLFDLYESVKGREVVADIVYGGEKVAEVTVTIDPSAFSPALLNEVSAVSTAGDAGAGNDYALNLILKLVKTWNLVIKGEPVPLTREGIDSVPFFVITPIVEAITKDQTPGND